MPKLWHWVAAISANVAVSLLLAALVSVALSGCVTDAAMPSCPTLSTVSPELRARIADEAERLPEGSALGWVVTDWVGLRDQVRACQAAR